MQDIILATDLAQHMAVIPNLQKMADGNIACHQL
jgi:hypothetical protein